MKIAVSTFTVLFLVAAVSFTTRAQQADEGRAKLHNAAQSNVAASAGTSDADATDSYTTPSGGSQVRIVRLSEVKERVLLDRNTGNGFEPTIANMPIVQGAKLKTLQGLAEVEFEDNSTLRITPQTSIEFPTLARFATGETANVVKLLQGTLYVNLEKTKGNEFVVKVGGKTISLPPGGHIRVDVYPAESELYVFHGQVTVTDSAQSVVVDKGRSLTFGGPADAAPVVAKDSTPGLYDEWDHAAVEYHNARAAFAGSPGYAFGGQDLSYYGSFSNVAGCGQMWRPYFASAAWDPFSNGLWAYYPGAGYSYVSPYPWGWLPFHTGSWASCGGGWGWQPGGQFVGVSNHLLFKTIKGLNPVRPIAPPAPGKPTYVMVSKTALPFAHVGAGNTFQFTKDSAGLGVPRATFGKLDKISAQVMERGSVERPMEVDQLLRVTGETHASAPVAKGGGAVAHGGAAGVSLASRPVAVSSSAGARGGNESSGSSSSSRSSGVSPVSSSTLPSAPASASSSHSGGGSSAGSSGGHH